MKRSQAMGNASHQQIPHSTRQHAVVPTILCTLIFLSVPAWRLLQAQATAHPKIPSSPTPTLHVYANLKQVPVLVLTQNYQRMKPIDTSRFRLSLDSGPLFRPTYVRQEGEDPISLAILIDASKPDSDVLPQLAKAIGGLAPDYLRHRDHVSIYVLDCTLIRTAYDLPADSSELEQAVQKALMPWQIRQKQKKGTVAPCKPTLPLWDSMSSVLDDLSPQSGRRVLLAITDGEDGGSKTLWTNVMHRAQVGSVAIFGMLPMPVIGTTYHLATGETFLVNSSFLKSNEDKFSQICSLSGGVEIQERYAIVSWRLKEFSRIVRERYILEFPRAPNEEPGDHSLAVTYKKRELYIVSSGISVPAASEEEKSGANTIPANSVQAPSEGNRKILLPNQ